MNSGCKIISDRENEVTLMPLGMSVKNQFMRFLQSLCMTLIFFGTLVSTGTAFSASHTTVPGTLGTSAQATKPIEKITPVRVVCLASSQEAFLTIDPKLAFLEGLRDIAGVQKLLTGNAKNKEMINAFLNKQYPPVGGWHYLPIGSGFVVDSDRQYVVTNWHVAQLCQRNDELKMQIGIIESSGFDLEPIPALHVGTRPAKDEKGNEIIEHVYVRALCQNRKLSCSKDYAKNVELFAPDIAVLKLSRPARTSPIPLATSPMLDPNAVLTIAGYPQVTMQLSQGPGSVRTQSTTPTLAPAKFSNLQSFDNFDLGIDPKEIIKTEFMMLAAQIHPGNSGGPLLFNNQVVGLVTATVAQDGSKTAAILESGIDDAAKGRINSIPSGYGLAVPVSEVSKMLAWLNIKPTGLPLLVSVPQNKSVIEKGPDPIPSVVVPWWESTNNKIIIGLLACVLVAGSAFFVMARDRTRENERNSINILSPKGPANPTAGIKNPIVEEPKVDQVKKPETPKESYPVAVQLKCSHGAMNGKTFTIPTPNGGMALVVGRNPLTCQIVFPNETDLVGRQHCNFVWNPNNRTFVVEDMDSSNGTFVNGRKLNKGEKSILKNGDTIDIGAASMNRFSVNIV